LAKEFNKMPVVNISKSHFKELLEGYSIEQIIDILPYISLDIEGEDDREIRIEYNPNRPDFANEFGIIRALNGILNIQKGIPKFETIENGDRTMSIIIDSSVIPIRPVILGICAYGKWDITLELAKQIISTQEDLHNGIGRGRNKASIGIHDLDKLKFPIYYTTLDSKEKFIPLDEKLLFRFDQVLEKLEVGKKYRHILKSDHIKNFRCPVLIDSLERIISFPPIINSDFSKIEKTTRNLFVEITASNQDTAINMLSIMAYFLFDAGFSIKPIFIHDQNNIFSSTSVIQNFTLKLNLSSVNKILGLNLNVKQIEECLNKSRIGTKILDDNTILCEIPAYRVDIKNEIDLVEEVIIGFGILNLKPNIASFQSGKFHPFHIYLSFFRELLIGFGFQEVVNFNLINENVQYDQMNIMHPVNIIRVEKPKSSGHEILRDSLIPSLLNNLSHNVHEEYPQKIFEIGKSFRLEDKRIVENWNLGIMVSHKNTGYTELKSILQYIMKIKQNKQIVTKSDTNSIYIDGRCASIILDGCVIGHLGEIHPQIINNFSIRIPVTAIEINLSLLF